MIQSIRILIVDDHLIVRTGLRTVIANEPGMEVIGEAADGVEAVAMARQLRPDVILMDLVMPRMDGLAATTEITRDNPDARILVLTSFDEDGKVFPAIKAGATGYLLKDTTPYQLVAAIRDVCAGRPSLHPSIALKLMREIKPSRPPAPSADATTEPLTGRELEVLRLVARGMSNQEIARALVINERTVMTHVSSILHKLHLANRTQAALYALQEGYARPPTGVDMGAGVT